MYGALQTINPAELSLGLSDSQFPFSVMQRLHPILSDSVMMDDQLIPFYKANFEKENFDSAIVLPLFTRDSGLGELWLLKKDSDAFSQNDLHFSASICTQLAFYIEQNALLGQTDEKLRQQNKQLNSLRQLSLEISASQDINYLLQLVFDETMRVINADYGNFLIFEESGQDEDGLKIVSFLGSPRFDELTDAEIEILRKGEPVIIPSLAEKNLWMPDNTVQAALFVPIRYFENDIGAILLYANDASQFDESSLEITQSIAAQASVVAGTSRQYEEQKNKSVLLGRQLRTMESLFQVSQKLRSNRPIGENLKHILNALSEITAFQRILISVYDPVNKVLRHSNAAGYSEEAWLDLRGDSPAWMNLKKILLPDFQIDSAYFIPAEKEVDGVKEFLLLDDESETDDDYLDSWQAGDLLLMPLVNANGTPLGLINVSKPFDGRRPDMSTIQALELFGMQAALMIEGQRYITALSTNLSEAEANQIKMQNSVRTIKQQVPLLLKQQMDYEIKIRKLDAEKQWVLLGLQANQLLSQTEKIESILPVLADLLIRETDFRTVLFAEQFGSGPKLLQAAGQAPEISRLEAQLGKKNQCVPCSMRMKSFWSRMWKLQQSGKIPAC